MRPWLKTARFPGLERSSNRLWRKSFASSARSQATVNPKTFRFSNLIEITSFDEENADLFHALHELGDLETRGGAENGSASR